MHRIPTAARSLLIAVALASTAAAQTPTFEGLGDLPGGAASSAAHDIAADGSVVVGESEGSAGVEAFKWTAGGGITGLGFLPGGGAPSRARAVSANGSVIVGSSENGSGVARAFRHAGGSFTELNGQSCSDCDPVTDAFGVSADGLVVLGYSAGRSGGTAPLHVDPVRWPGGGAGLNDLGNLSGSEEVGQANAASSNGGVIGGSHFRNHGQDAWVSTGSGLTALPALTAISPRTASVLAVSADGSTLAGFASKSSLTLPGGTEVAVDLQAVTWTGSGYSTIIELGSLPGAPVVRSRALATNGDGSLVVGTAANADAEDRAFVWDAVGGMRDLKDVLTNEHGLDLTGWILTSATGVSDPVSGGYFVTGAGVNPQGEPEGWVSFVIAPACSNGVDDEPDGFTDHPADSGCTSAIDWSETLDCSDGIDNDGDGFVDSAADAGCLSPTDPTERPDCSDGIDNDGDGLFDLADPGCRDATSVREDPACSDGLDNDGDLSADHPLDAECRGPWDPSELAACSDGIDNDGDTLVDFPADPDCASAGQLAEGPQCSDGIDNDGDGRVDHPEQYPGCIDANDPIEAPQCSDGVDNDGDGDVDHPADADCPGPLYASEARFDVLSAGLYVVDRTSRTLFFVDPGSGVQTLISQGAQIEAPQGLDRRGPLLLVADPAGLVGVWGSGAQQTLTPALSPNESLQVEVDGSGTAFILESDGIFTHDPGDPTTTQWMSVPTPEPLPNLGVLDGDTLAIEDDGSVLTTGLGFLGGGLIRVDPSTKVASPLDWGVFARAKWADLAIEDGGGILAVGREFDLGPGIYRLDGVDGSATALNDTYGWQTPTGVTVDRSTDAIWVADSGICADGACTGGSIVHVDPVSGNVTPLTSGGFIEGELDLVYLPEPSIGTLFGAGLLGLYAARARRRERRVPGSTGAGRDRRLD
ncbi:MAG: hypothetical protein OEV20_00675 [Actinomycetota bacterium]|nr:hypothetical protein [Actinomycetota bacterium]